MPQGWERTTLADICLPVNKVTPGHTPDQPFTYLDIASIDNATHRVISPKVYLGRDAPSRARQRVRDGDTLFSTVRTYLRNIAMVPPEFDGEVASTGFCVLHPADEVDRKFIFYFVQTDQFLSQLNPMQRGTSYPAVRNVDVLGQEIPLAPLPEQRRIVAEIEKQLTRLDASVAALERVRANLKRYRASLLKTACEGRLVPTEAELARAENRDYEPADRLLQRVLAERRARWQSQPRRRGKYKEPAPPDTSNLPKLPEGWVWATWSQLARRVTVGHVGPMKHEYIEAGVPFLRSQNVRANRFEPDGLKYISPTFHERLSKSTLQPGDLLVVRSGSVGVTCVVPESLTEANCADFVIVKKPEGIDSHYSSYYMNSSGAKSIVRSGQVGVALTHFNTKSVAALPVPLPPLPEQHRIVPEIERRLSVVQQAETVVGASLKRAGRLRQSILKQAFSGKLVPQDPNDEPASALLERIRAERAAAETAAKRQRKPRRHRSKRAPARQLSLS